MISKIRQRLAREEGFTLIELLVVVIIIGILLAIAVPSYLGFRDRAANRAAEANVRSAIPAVEAFYSDTGSYTGMTLAKLKDIDAGVRLSAEPVIRTRNVNGVATAGAGYCIQSTHNGTATGTHVKHLDGPGGNITDGPCGA